jgi:hypothetical protein
LPGLAGKSAASNHIYHDQNINAKRLLFFTKSTMKNSNLFYIFYKCIVVLLKKHVLSEMANGIIMFVLLYYVCLYKKIQQIHKEFYKSFTPYELDLWQKKQATINGMLPVKWTMKNNK